MSSPISDLSDTCLKRSKFILAPQKIATNVLFLTLCDFINFLIPAIDNAPAGSAIVRVSSYNSFIPAQISSVDTRIDESTKSLVILNVFSPICLTATPSAKMPTLLSFTLFFDRKARLKQSESCGSTAIILVLGLSFLMRAVIPARSPPPPTGTKI